MAKKTLTPEQAEIKAMKKAKSSQNWTKFWAIVLAAALTFGVVAMGKNAAQKAIDEATANANSNATVDNNAPSADNTDDSFNDMFDDNTSTDNNASSDNTATDNNTSSDNNTSTDNNTSNNNSSSNNSSSNNASSMSKDEQKKLVADAMNAATKKAAKGNYEMERVCKYQEGKGIKVTMLGGDATSVLNGAITVVDKNASLDSVVGGFLGIGTKKIKVTNGVGQRYGSDGTMADLSNEEKDYLLKAMNLSASDISNVKIDGNVYTFAIANIADPQKDNSNSMHKATNDFITESQVQTAIGSLTDAITVESANVSYYNILFVATMDNGNLKKLEMSYKADAVMKLKVGVAIDGSGSMEVNTVYNF